LDAELQALARRLEVDGQARFLGRVPDEDVRRWMRTAAVYVSMSEHESYGLSVAEAVAAGAAVVASDIPAHRQFARRFGPAVTLVPATASPAELAQAIARARRPSLEILPPVPSWQSACDHVLSIYARVLDRAPRTGASLHLAQVGA
jgi:glycosyltransferase involved in cell wall biosynthesis